jgi:hypothetical protein
MSEISVLFAVEAEQLLLTEMYDEAVELCEAGLKIYPEYASAYGIIARAHNALGRKDEALKTLETAIAKFPTNRLLATINSDIANAEIPDRQIVQSAENEIAIDIMPDPNSIETIAESNLEVGDSQDQGADAIPDFESLLSSALESNNNVAEESDTNTEEFDLDAMFSSAEEAPAEQAEEAESAAEDFDLDAMFSSAAEAPAEQAEESESASEDFDLDAMFASAEEAPAEQAEEAESAAEDFDLDAMFSSAAEAPAEQAEAAESASEDFDLDAMFASAEEAPAEQAEEAESASEDFDLDAMFSSAAEAPAQSPTETLEAVNDDNDINSEWMVEDPEIIEKIIDNGGIKNLDSLELIKNNIDSTIDESKLSDQSVEDIENFVNDSLEEYLVSDEEYYAGESNESGTDDIKVEELQSEDSELVEVGEVLESDDDALDLSNLFGESSSVEEIEEVDLDAQAKLDSLYKEIETAEIAENTPVVADHVDSADFLVSLTAKLNAANAEAEALAQKEDPMLSAQRYDFSQSTYEDELGEFDETIAVEAPITPNEEMKPAENEAEQEYDIPEHLAPYVGRTDFAECLRHSDALIEKKFRSRNLTLIPGLNNSPLMEIKLIPKRNIAVVALPEAPEFGILEPAGKNSLEDFADLFGFKSIEIKDEKNQAPLRSETVAAEPNEPHEALITETIANIYLLQGAFQEAIKAYHDLAERNPERKEHFDKKIADAMEKEAKALSND